jgi:hypothetical protein
MNTEEIHQYLNEIIEYALILRPSKEDSLGINLGNPNFETLSLPKVAMLTGSGVDPACWRNMAYV